eukprot:GSA25T00003674001.1
MYASGTCLAALGNCFFPKVAEEMQESPQLRWLLLAYGTGVAGATVYLPCAFSVQQRVAPDAPFHFFLDLLVAECAGKLFGKLLAERILTVDEQNIRRDASVYERDSSTTTRRLSSTSSRRATTSRPSSTTRGQQKSSSSSRRDLASSSSRREESSRRQSNYAQREEQPEPDRFSRSTKIADVRGEGEAEASEDIIAQVEGGEDMEIGGTFAVDPEDEELKKFPDFVIPHRVACASLMFGYGLMIFSSSQNFFIFAVFFVEAGLAAFLPIANAVVQEL